MDSSRVLLPSSLVLDSLDLNLIEHLQKDGRVALTELGQRLGVSHGTVRNRLDRLLAEGVIRITAVVDPAKVGFPTQVMIGLDADLKEFMRIEKQLSEFDEVYFVSTLTGRLDFLIGAVFPSDAELRDFLVEKLSSVNGVRGTETFHILSRGKRSWEWKIPRGGARLRAGNVPRS